MIIVTLVNCSFVFVFETGIDEQLARHYAHLFIRDPLTLFHEHVDEDDEQFTDHFEVHCILGTASAVTLISHGIRLETALEQRLPGVPYSYTNLWSVWDRCSFSKNYLTSINYLVVALFSDSQDV